MNEILRRRLIGFGVLLVLMLLLSLLLPNDVDRTGSGGLPTTTVALDGEPLSPPAAVPPPVEVPPAGTLPAPVVSAPPVPEKPPSTVAAHAARPGASATPPTVAPMKARPIPIPPSKSAAPAAKAAPAASAPTVVARTVVPAPAAPAAATPATAWYVQIGSYADAGNAQTTLSLLQNIGYRGEAAKIVNAKGASLYRVRLGPFATEATARQALDKVTRQGYPQARVLSESRAK